MKRSPTTFSLVLSLVALALLLALTLAAILSINTALKVLGNAYGRLVLASAQAADGLSTRTDAASRKTLTVLERSGVTFSEQAPPPPATRIPTLTLQIGHIVRQKLQDPARVAIVQTTESEVWIRSAYTPTRWIVVRTPSVRRQVVDSTLIVMILAGFIALAIASVAARVLTRPLEALSTHASSLLSGDPDVREKLRGGTREVANLANAIGAAGARLREASGERELMLAGISHDLRTPLARLRLALELGDANEPNLRDAMVTDLEELDNALEQCLAFVRDGRDEALRDINVATLVGQLLALRVQSDHWHMVGPELLNATARPTLLRRAIGNLMENAERYGSAPFTVSFGLDRKMLSICVSDQGPGVPETLIHQLGRPFLRGGSARSGISGSGLGLSIVQRAAELHGGTLELRNAKDGGFIATFRIPASTPPT